MRFTLLLGGAPRDHRRVRAAEQAALAEAEALARLWDGAPPSLDAIDEAAARLRARLFDLDRARAEAEWAASRFRHALRAVNRRGPEGARRQVGSTDLRSSRTTGVATEHHRRCELVRNANTDPELRKKVLANECPHLSEAIQESPGQ
jgi:hypothetical protein